VVFWTICLRRNVIDFCYKQDSLMRDMAAFDDSTHMIDARRTDDCQVTQVYLFFPLDVVPSAVT